MTGRILQIYTHEFFPKRGGIASYCHEFADAAARMGYETHVHAAESATSRNESAPYHLIRGKAKDNHLPLSLLKTRSLLKNKLSQQADDCHIFVEPGPILAFGSLSRKQIGDARTIAILHGSEINRWRKKGIYSHYGIRALDQVRRICTVSDPIRSLTQRIRPKLESKTRTVHNALPSAFARQCTQNRTDQRVSTAKFEILSVGRIHRRKGYDQMIKAIALLPEAERGKIRYTVAGSRKDHKYLLQIQQLALRKNVELRLQLDLSDEALAASYRGTDLFALTSVPYKSSIEGFGLVYLEAGAHGLPCVGYENGGVSDAIQNGVTGLLVPQGDLEALALAIQQLLENPDKCYRLGLNNRNFALGRSWRDVVRETLDRKE